MLSPIERSQHKQSSGDSHQQQPRPPLPPPARIWADPPRLRRLTGVIALLAFAVNLGLAQLTINDARSGEVSAVQIIQVWTPHIYYAILITGVAVAIYIYSRGAGD